MDSVITESTDSVVIIDQRRSDYVIIVGSSADETERFSAGELQNYLEQMTGARLPIQIDPEPAPIHFISIGQTQLAADAHFSVRLRHRFDDGFVIRNDQGNLMIRGACSRGTLFAVYALLEKWGCRWFAPDFAHYQGNHELVPQCDTIAFEEKVWIERPEFELRGSFIEIFVSDEPWRDIQAIIAWLAKVRKNYLGMDQHPLFDFREVYPGHRSVWFKEGLWEAVLETNAERDLTLAIGGHGFFTFLPPKVYFEQHPEWYALVDGERIDHGQICVSNKEAGAAYVSRYMDFVRAHPEIDIFCVMPNDGLKWCQCESCQALGSVLNQYLHVFNELAAAVEAYNPDVILQALFYAETAIPPDEKTRIHTTNTMGWYSNFSRDWSVPINHEPPGLVKADFPVKGISPLRVKGFRNYSYWAVLNKWLSEFYNFRIMVEDEYRKYFFNSYPCIKPHTMAREFPLYREIGVSDIYMDYMEPKDWYSYEPTHYFHARFAWDPYQDVDDAIADYAEKRYPGAGPEMVGYLTNVENGFNLFGKVRGFDKPLPDLERAREHFALADTALKSTLGKVSEPGAKSLIEKNVKSLHYVRDALAVWYLVKTGKPDEAIATGEALVAFLKENLDEGVFLYPPDSPFLYAYIQAYLDTLTDRPPAEPSPDIPFQG